MSDQIGVYKAITNVTGMMAKEGISKDRKNQQQGYSFRGIDDVYNVLGGMLANSGLCIIPRVLTRQITEKQTKAGAPLFYVIVEVEYDLVSSEDGSRHTARSIGEAMDSADKATNKAMSAAYKYMAFQTFAIPTEGDNDADAVSHSVRPIESRPSTPQQSAAGIAKAKAIIAPKKPIENSPFPPEAGDLTDVLPPPAIAMTEETKSAIIAAFANLGFTKESLAKEYGKPVSNWMESDKDELREVLKAKRIESVQAAHAAQSEQAHEL